MEELHQLEMCSYHYQKWKSSALSAETVEEAKNCFEKAFFWLEMQTAYIVLWNIEKAKGNSPEMKEKIIDAKLNMSKKLADYAKKILDEIQL